MKQRIIGGIALLGLWAAGCNGRSTTQSVGTESHFLIDCQTQAVCGPDLSCLGGRCTKTCDVDADCTSLSTASSCTVDLDGAGSSCDLQCNTEADCDSVESARCVQDQCRVPSQASGGGANGAGGNGDSGGSGNAAGGMSSAGGSGGAPSTGGASSCDCGPPSPFPVRMCDDGSFVGSASCVDLEDGSCAWQQDECPPSAGEGGASSGGTQGSGGAQGGSEAQGGGVPSGGMAQGGSEAQGGNSSGGANATAAGQVLDDCGIPVTGEPMVQEIALPEELTGPNWGIKADACEQGGWDLSLCAGTTATFTSFDTGATEQGDPTTIWVATLGDEVCCVYGSDDSNPGIYSVSCN